MKKAIILLALAFLSVPGKVSAAGVTSASDSMSRYKTSTASEHTIVFTSPTGVANGTYVDYVFDSNFTGVNAISEADFIWSDDGSTVPDSSITLSIETTTASNDTIRITLDTGSIAASSVITAAIGTEGSNDVTNPGSTGSYEITIDGTFGDDGVVEVPIIDDDQVTINATVDTYISFDLDVALTDTESATPYTVNLGELNYSTISASNGTTIPYIFFDLDTNSSGGATVQVKDANTGLSSTAAGYTIASTTELLQVSQNTDDGFGLQADITVTPAVGSVNEVSPYSSTGNNVGLVNPTWATIVNSNGAPVVGARGKIKVMAVASRNTPPASDYTDTLSLRAIGTY